MGNLEILSVLNKLIRQAQPGMIEGVGKRLKHKEGGVRCEWTRWCSGTLPLVAGWVHCRTKALPHGSVHRVCGSLWACSAPAPTHSESESEVSSELDALLLLSDLFSLSSASSSSSWNKISRFSSSQLHAKLTCTYKRTDTAIKNKQFIDQKLSHKTIVFPFYNDIYKKKVFRVANVTEFQFIILINLTSSSSSSSSPSSLSSALDDPSSDSFSSSSSSSSSSYTRDM